MKQQIILLKGGIAKENYKDFYDFIEKIKYNPYEEKKVKWSDFLGKKLGENYEVLKFPRPNSDFADYKARKIMFEKVFPFLKENFILVGHSLGTTFLVKYFSELDEKNRTIFLEKIKKIILVSACFEDDEIEALGSFNFDKSLKNYKFFEEKTVFFHSKDDFLVKFSDLENFRKLLPNSKYHIFEDRGHFLQEEFDEILEEIKK